MPKIAVNKSIVVAVSPDKAYETIRDFHQWNRWSPWVICEPDCQMTYADNGKSYAWDGKIIGSGSVEIAEEQPSEAIHFRLTFLKPWKSKATFSFLFQPEGDGVRVTWTMDSSLPSFLFFMKGMMTAMIGMDYDRGLRMLKDYLETGNVHSKLEYPGQADFEGFQYVGIRAQCSMTQIGDQMKADFERLAQWFKDSNLEIAEKPFAVYHRFHLSKGTTEFTTGYPVKAVPENLPECFVSAELAACPVYRVKHTGPYHHLGNAWSSGMMRAQAKVFRQNKKIPAFEIYESDPSTTKEEDTVTMIHFPIK
jgi:effector-binding domain-containing protein